MFPNFHRFDNDFIFSNLSQSMKQKNKNYIAPLTEKDYTCYEKERGTETHYESPSLPSMIWDSKFCYIQKPTDEHPKTYLLVDIYTEEIGDLYKEFKQLDYDRKNLMMLGFVAKGIGGKT